MSELGNINKSFGKPINISVANTYSATVLNSKALPANMIVISSPTDEDGNDIGTYCLIATDNNGTGVRLSYTIQPGNGLNIDNTNTDILKLDVDSSSLNTNINNELQVNMDDIVDWNTLSVENDKLQVNTNNLPIATEETNGVVIVDNATIKLSDTGNLYINVEDLDKANETTVGIITSDNNTVHIDSNGIVSVNTQNLSEASANDYGIVKVDGLTINSTYGNTSVNTHNLKYCTDTSFGILKPDNNIVKVTNGELSIITQNITHASNSQYGVMKTDGISLISNNGVVSVNNYDKLISDIEGLVTKLDNIESTIVKLNQKISYIG